MNVKATMVLLFLPCMTIMRIDPHANDKDKVDDQDRDVVGMQAASRTRC